jgi:hypothetical protein
LATAARWRKYWKRSMPGADHRQQAGRAGRQRAECVGRARRDDHEIPGVRHRNAVVAQDLHISVDDV